MLTIIKNIASISNEIHMLICEMHEALTMKILQEVLSRKTGRLLLQILFDIIKQR